MITIAEIEAGICCSEFLDVRNHNHIAIKRDLDTGEGEYTIGFYHVLKLCPFCGAKLQVPNEHS